MSLTKADIADRLFNEVGLNKREAKEFVDAYFEIIREALEVGENVKLSGFGNFQLREKNQRPGRNPKTGKEIPISAVTQQSNTSGFSEIKHKDAKRVVTVYSALAPGYTDATAIVSQIQREMKNFSELPKKIKIDYTGQIEEQNKEMAFLVSAFFIGL